MQDPEFEAAVADDAWTYLGDNDGPLGDPR